MGEDRSKLLYMKQRINERQEEAGQLLQMIFRTAFEVANGTNRNQENRLKSKEAKVKNESLKKQVFDLADKMEEGKCKSQFYVSKLKVIERCLEIQTDLHLVGASHKEKVKIGALKKDMKSKLVSLYKFAREGQNMEYENDYKLVKQAIECGVSVIICALNFSDTLDRDHSLMKRNYTPHGGEYIEEQLKENGCIQSDFIDASVVSRDVDTPLTY